MSETELDKRIKDAKNKSWVAIVLFLGVIVIGIGAFTDSLDKILSFIEKRIQPHVYDESRPEPSPKENPLSSSEGKLERFGEGTFGILVGTFAEATGTTEEERKTSETLQRTIAATLNARFSELKITNAEAKVLPSSVATLFKGHEEARALGYKYNAQFVIWGDITQEGVTPNITIVYKQSQSSLITKLNASLLKNSLTHIGFSEVKEIRLPALTKEPTALISFVTGLKSLQEGNYKTAVTHFKKSLPESLEEYQTPLGLVPIYFYMGYAHMKLQNYATAIQDFGMAIEINPNLGGHTTIAVLHMLKKTTTSQLFKITKRPSTLTLNLKRHTTIAVLHMLKKTTTTQLFKITRRPSKLTLTIRRHTTIAVRPIPRKVTTSEPLPISIRPWR